MCWRIKISFPKRFSRKNIYRKQLYLIFYNNNSFTLPSLRYPIFMFFFYFYFLSYQIYISLKSRTGKNMPQTNESKYKSFTIYSTTPYAYANTANRYRFKLAREIFKNLKVMQITSPIFFFIFFFVVSSQSLIFHSS